MASAAEESKSASGDLPCCASRLNLWKDDSRTPTAVRVPGAPFPNHLFTPLGRDRVLVSRCARDVRPDDVGISVPLALLDVSDISSPVWHSFGTVAHDDEPVRAARVKAPADGDGEDIVRVALFRVAVPGCSENPIPSIREQEVVFKHGATPADCSVNAGAESEPTSFDLFPVVPNSDDFAIRRRMTYEGTGVAALFCSPRWKEATGVDTTPVDGWSSSFTDDLTGEPEDPPADFMQAGQLALNDGRCEFPLAVDGEVALRLNGADSQEFVNTVEVLDWRADGAPVVRSYELPDWVSSGFRGCVVGPSQTLVMSDNTDFTEFFAVRP